MATLGEFHDAFSKVGSPDTQSRLKDIKVEMIRLVQRGKSVRLQAPEGIFSYYHPNHLFTGLGWDAQTASLLLMKRTVRSILILGLGGGTVARQCRAVFPEAAIVGVDIDRKVIKLAYEHFDLGSINTEVVALSGQHYLRTMRRRFDAIIDDMWPPEPFSPKPALTESDWLTLIRSRLQHDGVYALNLYSRQENPRELAIASRRLRTRFPDLREVCPGPGQTTVIAAGSDLRLPRQAYARVRRLPKHCASGLNHVKFVAL